jgi:hypothetical protein
LWTLLITAPEIKIQPSPIRPFEKRRPSSEGYFDPAQLRLDPAQAENLGVQKLLTSVPVRKPNQQEFIRVNSDPAYRIDTAIIELKEDHEIYIVPPLMAHQLPDETKLVSLFTVLNRQRVLFLWPVKIPSVDGRANEWHRSAREAAERAMISWLKIKANMSLGAYDLFEAIGALPEPEWPEIAFAEILRTAFRDRYVGSVDHPLLKRLRGEV